MADQYLLNFYWVFLLSAALLLYFLVNLGSYSSNKSDNYNTNILPRPYPLLGHVVGILRNRHCMIQWTAELLLVSTTNYKTKFLHFPLRRHPHILTANPANVQHILKTRFDIYQKTKNFRAAHQDLFQDNLFLSEGGQQRWKKLRQLFGHRVNSRSFLKFAMLVTNNEVSNRLLPFLISNTGALVDLNDILRRFTYDVVFRMVLGHDLAYLSTSNSNNLFPQTKFADSFEAAKELSWMRLFSVTWKAKRFLNMGSEKRLQLEISEMREFLRQIISRKNEAARRVLLDQNINYDNDDFISGLLLMSSNNNNDQRDDDDDDEEEILIGASINLILAGVETLLAALKWFFLSVSKNPNVEDKIVKEVKDEKKDIRDMIYTHASIFESMRLYPPVPLGGLEATQDDVLPDGTNVNMGTTVIFHTYAMGRSPELWGSDWPDFRPERWLKRSEENHETFLARDSYTYPVFHGGPRICLGKEIALAQMKTVVAAVLRRFHFVPAMEEKDYELLYSSPSSNGFLVKVVHRK
ncbi:cytochrome P450 94A1-like [Lycium ferocissimum]|uniref:cytochrome P450 94A1-like n=1 Tax=Lycium ferocissimum TaxID=112874 RepID=UPI00281627B6|nr:cytochrome P450 94A1-like [Lycium ferocissimum]